MQATQKSVLMPPRKAQIAFTRDENLKHRKKIATMMENPFDKFPRTLLSSLAGPDVEMMMLIALIGCRSGGVQGEGERQM